MSSCVYWITYSGDKHPQNYIGSTYSSKIDVGYLGSPTSKKWSGIVKEEQKLHPHLYSISIIHNTKNREDATIMEREIQKLYNVVRSNDFWNMSIASPNGCFGMDVSGENNPRYGKSPYENMDESEILKNNLEKSERMQGNRNHRSVTHYLFAPNGKPTYKTEGDINKFCKEHNISKAEFIRSLNTGVGMYERNLTKISESQLKNNGRIKWRGWRVV